MRGNEGREEGRLWFMASEGGNTWSEEGKIGEMERWRELKKRRRREGEREREREAWDGGAEGTSGGELDQKRGRKGRNGGKEGRRDEGNKGGM